MQIYTGSFEDASRGREEISHAARDLVDTSREFGDRVSYQTQECCPQSEFLSHILYNNKRKVRSIKITPAAKTILTSD